MPLPVIVCIPARDEAAALPALFAALSALAADEPAMAVCLYLDGDDGGSAEWLRRNAALHPFALDVAVGDAAGEPNAGAARRAAMAMGLDRLGTRDGLLFTTDADSQPRRGWIAAGRAALASADVAAGRIVRRAATADPEQARIERYYDRLHAYRRLVDPVPWEARDTHHFSGGANIAIRAAAYRAIGGFRPLPFAEDATLLDDAARAGLRVRRDGAMLVETSSRRHGRAVQGLASALRALDDGQAPRMSHPDGAAWQWAAQAAARHAFATIDDSAVRLRLAERLGLTGDHILGVARDCANAEAFAMRIVPAASLPTDGVSLAEAEEALARLEAALCEVAA
ncbi:glycosyl transferase family 2 [Sphingomonas sp. RP10(2022)]|uniref:Glycosyl transferase family 2 n=1 Tax=Sphingomonas liriopis TaxID=2949094 RepID=A0A9X2HWY8_9SPHN|nr:glycosyl transferase family 2 [Sphingomonas liriopis]MCP3735756.1 glycosyl transferase family 2 [Sphingomonas liriopis]